jgi:uncharacterized repeat protein (TIGR03806 family)
MKIPMIIAILGLTMVFGGNAVAQGTGGLDRATAIEPFLNGALPRATPRPSTGNWQLVNAFPSLTFIDPVQMLPVPFSKRLMVVEKAGRLVVFENSATTTAKTVLIDIRSQVESSHDSGMMGLAFHPQFGVPGSANRHFLYVFYRWTPQKSQTNPGYCRLSRFTWDPATNSIAPGSESVLINQYDRHNWHNGGGILFGPDGFLYLSIGDEGGANDQYDSGQRMDTGLLAGVLRIDVDRDPTKSHAIRRQPRNPATPPAGWPNSSSQGYFIPNDNPWQSPDGSRLEEFHAIGLRSPHRMTIDPATGQIWVGDVGQGTQEEVSRVVRGGNLQWPYREGSVAGPKAKPAALIGTDVAPVYSYGRSLGGCVIGGYVYRGSLHPELEGRYLFGDHVSGRIWSLDASGATPTVTSLLTLTAHGPGPKNGMGSFGIDASGEIYVLSLAGTDLDGGRIYRLEKSSGGIAEPPRLLSQTTAFTNLATLAPAQGVMPYDVIQPLWSDGAEKRRWLAVPNDGTPNTAAERIGWSEEGNWTFPNGTVLIKHFEVPGRRLETRFFVRGNDGVWFGFTYRWRPDGSDAELLPEEPLDETFTVNGSTRTWHFPGRAECSSCHTEPAGRVLGLRTRQMNRDFLYSTTGRTANQITTLNRLGFFSPAVDEAGLAAMLTSRAQGDNDATLERRARSYLDANCSHCHQPGTQVQASFDARLTTPPWSQNLINGIAGNNLGTSGARLVKPTNLNLSIVHRRAGSTAAGIAMPPVGKNLVDTAGLQLLSNWINSLDPSIGPTGPVTGSPPRDSIAPVLTLTRSGGTGPVTGPFTVSLTAGEPILGLTAADFTLVNATVSNLAGSGASWTFTVTPVAAGAGSVTIGSDRITDANGNANPALATPLAFTHQPPPVPVNLLTNGGFESGLDGWDRGGSVSTTTTAYRGVSAASVGASTWITRGVSVTERVNHVFRGWIAAAGPGVRAEAGLTFWDANGVWIEDRTLVIEPGTSWQAFQLAFTAPVGARNVSVWFLTNGSGGIRLDELVVETGGTGVPLPVFQPDMTNRIENGGFESGLAAWDTGGTVTLANTPKSGTRAARIGAESYVVQTKAVVSGRKLALAGSALTATGGRFEAGFSFWDASGAWITDRTLMIGESVSYRDFLVDTVVPERSARVTVWIWVPAGSAATVDDLVLFDPDELVRNPGNLLSNGGFESGSLLPWDTGGTAVSLVTNARTGSGAARVGSEAFLVHNQSATPGERYLLTGHAIGEGTAGASREAGFSFWSRTGQWLGDRVVPLASGTTYAAFSVEGLVPENAASFSTWIWCGAGGAATVDDLSLKRTAEASTTPAPTLATPLAGQEAEALAGDLTLLSLKSARSLDLVKIQFFDSDSLLSAALGTALPVYATGWFADFSERAAEVFASAGGSARKSLAMRVDGPGIVSVQWSVEGDSRLGVLKLFVDGRETERLDDGNGPAWRTVAVNLATQGMHTLEFRLEPSGIDGLAPADLRVGLREFEFYPGIPQLQPDLAIASRNEPFTGTDLIDPTGLRQTVWAPTTGSSPANFRVRWRNRADELADGARFWGPTGDPRHQVSYFAPGNARINVTSNVASGLWETRFAAPGAGLDLEISVRRTSKKRPRTGFSGSLRATSLLRETKSDRVGFRTIPR